MKFPITKAEFLAWCRENGGKRVEPMSCSRCIIARAIRDIRGQTWDVALGLFMAFGEHGVGAKMPKWAVDLATKFDRRFAFDSATTVRTALRELAKAGVPGFTKKELREAAGL